MNKSPLTRALTERHEALYPRVETLTRQIEQIAARRPATPVPAATRAIAEGLLFDLQPFMPRRERLPVAAGDMAGLATQLGQMLAALDAFEAARTHYSGQHNCFTWTMRGDPIPVKRHRATIAQQPSPRESRELESIRHRLIKRIDASKAEAYETGYTDATAGRPNREAQPM